RPRTCGREEAGARTGAHPPPPRTPRSSARCRRAQTRTRRCRPRCGCAWPSDLLERRVLEHELPLAAVVCEADGDEAAGLYPRDDALAERAGTDAVARPPRRDCG